MPEIITADQLITEVREQSDELNTSTKPDAAILRVLNRGQRIANDLLAIHYPDTLLRTTNLDLTQGDTFAIPTDCYADMAEYIEISVPGFPAETRRRSYRDSTRLQSAGPVAIPFAWATEGRNIRFLQTPTGAYGAKLWYVRKLEKLTKQQGQITTIGSTYLTIDTSGMIGSSSLSQDANSNSSYINIINFQTGEIRATFQIASISGGRVNIRSSPQRASVLGRTVSGSAALATCGAVQDDFICLAEGTCVPYFQDSIATYLTQYGAAELARSLASNQSQLEDQILKDAEARVEAAWAGRESTARIKNRSQQWPNTYRRWPVSNK